MEILNLAAILITLAALFSYINHRFIGLPNAIGVMVIALLFSLSLIGLGKAGIWTVDEYAARIVGSVDFDETLLHGMLSFLLFAGALHVNLDDLLEQKWVILSLATFGVLLSTALIGFLSWGILQLFGISVPLIYCLLFGALISPTDPIAVLATLKSAGVAKSLETKITGESLFNDGVGVVIFLVLLGTLTAPEEASVSHAIILFAEEAIGGVILGLALGYIGFRMLRSIDNHQVEILITLAMVMGGYALATAIHTSGPIAMVVAGLFIGNRGRKFAMSDSTRRHLDTFWELLDEILNAALFVLIGLEVLALEFTETFIAAGLVAIPLVLLVRGISVGLPITLLRFRREFSPKVVRILVWGGIRGGISVALALSLPPSSYRDLIIGTTYVIVVFSIIVQGLTIARVASNRD